MRSRLPLLLAAALLALATTACTGFTVANKTVQPTDTDGVVEYTITLSRAAFEPGDRSPGTPANPDVYTRITTPDSRWVRHCFDAATHGEQAPYFCTSGHTPMEGYAIALTFPLVGLLAWFIAGRTLARMPHRELIVPRPGERSRAFRSREAEALAGYEPEGLSTRRYLLTTIGAGMLLAFVICALLVILFGRNNTGNWALVAAAVNSLVIVYFVAGTWFRTMTTDTRLVRVVFLGGFIFGLVLAGISL